MLADGLENEVGMVTCRCNRTGEQGKQLSLLFPLHF